MEPSNNDLSIDQECNCKAVMKMSAGCEDAPVKNFLSSSCHLLKIECACNRRCVEWLKHTKASLRRSVTHTTVTKRHYAKAGVCRH